MKVLKVLTAFVVELPGIKLAKFILKNIPATAGNGEFVVNGDIV